MELVCCKMNIWFKSPVFGFANVGFSDENGRTISHIIETRLDYVHCFCLSVLAVFMFLSLLSFSFTRFFFFSLLFCLETFLAGLE